MTNKEAVEIITSDFEMAAIPGEHLEAYNMAIKALTEKSKSVIIIKPNLHLDAVSMAYISDKLKVGFEKGLIIVPEFCDVTVVGDADGVEVRRGKQ